MTRTAPSRADQALISELAGRGLTVTATQIERWRRAGLLPRNIRHGRGRGAGSVSEAPQGTADYVEALVSSASQGRNAQRTALSLFIAGILKPDRQEAGDPLFETYEAAVRRAFRWQIDRSDKDLRRIREAVTEPSEQDPDGLDAAYSAAAAAVGHEPHDGAAEETVEAAAARRGYGGALRAERQAARLAGWKPPTLDDVQTRMEQALLAAALGDVASVERAPSYRMAPGRVPVDAAIFARGCSCAPRTEHFASTPEGLLEILDTASFAELDLARAIGGSVTMLAPAIRNGVLANPADEKLQAAAWLYSNTFFRGFFSSFPMFRPEQPETIVKTTLLFLYNCQWLRSGAALLATLASKWVGTASVEERNALPAITTAFAETVPRSRWLRSGMGLRPVLQADGTAKALNLLKDTDPWMWTTSPGTDGCLAPYHPS
jgi:hypothetical protein